MSQLPHCNDPSIRDFRCPPTSAAGHISTPPEHHHEPENEHLFGFKYWHFFDIASDAARSAARITHGRALQLAEGTDRAASIARKALPALRFGTRALPVVGVVGELMHVATPFAHARDDWSEGKISAWKFGGLCALYGAYTITGLGGFLTAGIKEGLTNAAQHWDWMDQRYIPHSLYQEFQHAGWFGGEAHDHHHDNDHNHDHARAAQADHTLGVPHFHAVGGLAECTTCAAVMAQMKASPVTLSEVPLSAPTTPSRVIQRLMARIA